MLGLALCVCVYLSFFVMAFFSLVVSSSFLLMLCVGVCAFVCVYTRIESAGDLCPLVSGLSLLEITPWLLGLPL